MINARIAGLLITLTGFLCLPDPVAAEYVFNLQAAEVFTSKNDVRIPGDTGTRFSFSDDLKTDTKFTGRLEAGYIRDMRDYFGVVVSPLSLSSHGRLDRDIRFAGKTFPAGTDLDATFRFDSYRFTWRRNLVTRDDLDTWVGLTAKVRDAAITVEGGGLRAEKKNTGFVPLINFLIDWRFTKPWTFRVAGDALGSTQGRAEDVFFAMMYDVSGSTRFFAGYRVLEGGADNSEVYTFSLFHYAVAGMEIRF